MNTGLKGTAVGNEWNNEKCWISQRWRNFHRESTWRIVEKPRKEVTRKVVSQTCLLIVPQATVEDHGDCSELVEILYCYIFRTCFSDDESLLEIPMKESSIRSKRGKDKTEILCILKSGLFSSTSLISTETSTIAILLEFLARAHLTLE